MNPDGFTLRVMVGGVTRLAETMTFDRWRRLAPEIEPMIPTLEWGGPVAFLADVDGVTHILGRWR